MPQIKHFPKPLLDLLYNKKGMSQRDVARFLGVSPQCVRRNMKRHGLVMRPRSEAIQAAFSSGKLQGKSGESNPNYRHGKSGRYNKYGIDEEFACFLLEEQGNSCQICSVGIDTSTGHIDHCHTTGDVRGWLCRSCNHGLGNFKDNVSILNKAALYLFKANP